jgi:hypothetical protein
MTTWTRYVMAALLAPLALHARFGHAGFALAPSMVEARQDHAAVLLPTGGVLVTGGNGGEGVQAASEWRDPATGAFATIPPMREARAEHRAVVLASGLVLVTGGHDTRGYALASTALYDPLRRAWTPGPPLEARALHTATLLPSGRVLVTGGTYFVPVPDVGTQFLASAQVYDPVTGTWLAAAPMATARAGHTATLLPSGRVLVTGGETRDGATYRALGSAELYDPVTDTWSAAAAMGEPRAGHTATLLDTGDVLVAGGVTDATSGRATASAETWNATSATWSPTGAMNASRTQHTATRLFSGDVLVVAGTGGAIGTQPSELTAERYDPASRTWSVAGVLPEGSLGVFAHTATLLPTGEVLVAGGGTGTHFGATRAVSIFDDRTASAVEYRHAASNRYFVTARAAEIAVLDGGAFGGAWQRTGEAFPVWTGGVDGTLPTCRFFSPSFGPPGTHFYTPIASECEGRKRDPAWQFEDIAFGLRLPDGYGTGHGRCPRGTAPLYRLYDNGIDGAPAHRYTARTDIVDAMIAAGWTFEGEAATRVFACIP